jgi:type III secretion protein SpaR/YscT/HrcT
VIPELNDFLVNYTLTVVRILAAVAIAPFLSSQILTGPTRYAFVLAWGMILYPFVEPTIPHDLRANWLLMLGLLVKEIVLGVMLGFFASKAFFLAINIGYLIDTQRGSTMASVLAPGTGEQTSVLGQMFEQIAVALFYTGGGFLIFLGAVFDSYTIWPVMKFLPAFQASFPKMVLADADLLMQMTLVFAAPLVMALFLAEFGLGLVNRFAPSLNVFSLAMPVKSLLAIILLVFYLPFMFSYLGKDLGATPLLDFMKGLAP